MSPETNANYKEPFDFDTQGLYLREVEKFPQLSDQRVVELSRLIQKGLKAKDDLAKGELNELEEGSLKEQIELGENARTELVSSNLPLVIFVAKKFHFKNNFMDVIQEGNLGLLRAAESFNPEMGFSFSTYAVPKIEEKITRYLNSDYLICLPDNIFWEIKNLKSAVERLEDNLGRSPTNEELAKELNIAAAKVKELLRANDLFRVASLNKKIGDSDEPSELGDFIVDKEANNLEENVEVQDRRRIIKEVIAILSPQKRRVLERFFGLAGFQGQNLSQISWEEDVSPPNGKKRENKQGKPLSKERVRQVFEEALSELKVSERGQELFEIYLQI